jgi:hypothetical protein
MMYLKPSTPILQYSNNPFFPHYSFVRPCDACHGQRSSISRTKDQLRKVRISTSNPKTSTLAKVRL